MVSGMPVMAAEGRVYKEVNVPAEWIPVDPHTGEVLSHLGVRKTDPGMYPRSEVAELTSGPGEDPIYSITYMGTPAPLSPGSWSANNFMYIGNVMYRNKFFRVIANGISQTNPDYKFKNSSVLRLQYGEFEDEDMTDGLHGITKTPYQEGETLKLYLATVESSLSEVEFAQDTLTLLKPTTTAGLLDEIIGNVKSYRYLSIDPLSFADVPSPALEQFEQIFIYHYDSLGSESGTYLEDGGKMLNLKVQDDSWIDGLTAGKYEIVLPFYVEVPIHTWLSGPDVFSRNRYTLSDSIHFTLILEEEVIPTPDPVYPEDVTVKYVDEDGNNIVDPVILSGRLGASWKAEEKSIDGWTIAERPSVVSGVFTAYAQEVIFVYERVTVGAGDVTVKYVDEDGNDIVDPVILTGKIGESWKAEDKDIIGWVLSVIPDNVSGTFTSESQIVIFVYKEEVVKGAEDDEDETPDDLNPPVTGEPALYMLLAILMVLGGTLLTVPSLKRAWAKNKRED